MNRFFIGCAALVAVLNGPAPAAAQEVDQPAPSGGTLTVYRTACPPGYTGADSFADCFDNPEAGIAFAVSNFKSSFDARGTTDSDGFVQVQLPDDLAGNLVTVGQTPPVKVAGGAPPPFAVACTRNGGQPVDFHPSLIQLDPGGDAYNVEINNIAPGDQIRCDWYALPPPAGAAPTPASGGPVTRLPATGSGATTNNAAFSHLLAALLAALLAVASGAVACRWRVVR